MEMPRRDGSQSQENEILDRDEEEDVETSSSASTDGDSDFYGDKNLREKYEEKAQHVNADEYWRVHDWNVQVIAVRAVKRHPTLWSKAEGKKRKRDNDQDDERGKDEKKSKTRIANSPTRSPLPTSQPKSTKPYNPYEGNSTAFQIDESIETFVARLQPSSADTVGPWIYCANFHSGERASDPDVAGFKQAGTRLLDNFLVKRQKLEAQFDPPKTEGAITRMMAGDRAELESDILAAAKKHKLTQGKWMLFPAQDKVDKYWEAVVRATVEERLGTAAKVATRPEKPEESTQVICIYTRDMTDEADVKRVLLELARLKLAPALIDKGLKKGAMKGQIWYKPDCYTYLDITSGNEYKVKPTLYGSASLLTAADVKGLS